MKREYDDVDRFIAWRESQHYTEEEGRFMLRFVGISALIGIVIGILGLL